MGRASSLLEVYTPRISTTLRVRDNDELFVEGSPTILENTNHTYYLATSATDHRRYNDVNRRIGPRLQHVGIVRQKIHFANGFYVHQKAVLNDLGQHLRYEHDPDDPIGLHVNTSGWEPLYKPLVIKY